MPQCSNTEWRGNVRIFLCTPISVVVRQGLSKIIGLQTDDPIAGTSDPTVGTGHPPTK
jgi:hypothetical protein